MDKRSIGIIGGGAAGMAAAITAAREGAKVTIFEAGERLGKKLLSTGNGKCNLGNQLLDENCYYGARKFVKEALERFGTEDTISFFEGMGLMLRERNGYLYPWCEQASVVLDVLRNEIAVLGIRVICQAKVIEVMPKESAGFKVRTLDGDYFFDRVILACGGKAAPKTGSDGSGYDLAKKLGHGIAPVVPALTALKCKESFFKGIAGVRADAEVTILGEDGKAIAKERGELQLTDYGISGIPVFQLSRIAAYQLQKRKEIAAYIDFLPDLANPEEAVNERMALRGTRTVEELFVGTIHKKLVSLVLKQINLKPTDSSDRLSRKQIQHFFFLAKRFPVTAVATGDFQSCQVCAGGVDLGQMTENMESKLHKGLYFVGEIVDVDGRCGGYNLQWAWTSGHIAGRHAAGRQE